jgi:hypothetical protein
MHDVKKYPCHAVLVQYGHDPTSGERLNFGVVLVCQRLAYAGARFTRKLSRISKAFPDADVPALRAMGKHMEDVARKIQPGQLDCGVEMRDARKFYHAAFPEIDSSVLLSDPIVGVTADPQKTLDALYRQYVARFMDGNERTVRADADVWNSVSSRLEARQVSVELLTEKVVAGNHYEFKFQHAWKNGRWNAVQPLSFDLTTPTSIVEKAAKWSGKMRALHLEKAGVDVFMLIGEPTVPNPDFLRATSDGIALLREQLEGQATILEEERVDDIVDKIARDLASASDQG